MFRSLPSVARSMASRRPIRINFGGHTTITPTMPLSTKTPFVYHHNTTSFKRQFTATRSAMEEKKTVTITYLDAKDDTSKTVEAEIGMDLMHVAHENNIDLEGACGGELACSTCHLIFQKEVYDRLPKMEEEEEDMLDLAFEVTETSRLGCQILVREDFDGMTVTIPDDGF
ncbi:2Fe-2S ferredoxin-type domain containing protein [Nitzschia inconspicua]|uniref:2Fe-2S ferredoxin-type domain containing protein n=1 Tax=Nitzschia inconspicua TaxID=303405 RepID=A0A9K3Q072_9STRA|nr:2Fe-2S ferredoxin-type domain containing protein [Nitzschia inconspicua]